MKGSIDGGVYYRIHERERLSFGKICFYGVRVVVLSLTVEWGVGMERQDPSYGVVVHTSV